MEIRKLKEVINNNVRRENMVSFNDL